MSGRVIRSVSVPVSAGVNHVSIPLDATAYAALAAKGSALISFETANDEVQAFDLALAQPTVTLTQSSATSFQNDPVTLTATVTGTNPFPGTPTGTVQFTVDNVAHGAPVALDSNGVATLVTTTLPPGTHTITAVYSGDGDYASATSAPVSHLTKGIFEQLADMHTLVNGFGLSTGLAGQLNTGISQAEKQAGLGPSHYSIACEKLDDNAELVLDNAGLNGLSYTEAVQYLDASNRVGALLGCTTAVPPTPAALDHVVQLMGTIAGMGLTASEASSLTSLTREIGKKLVDHQAFQACKKVGDLRARIAADTGVAGKLTAAQGATLAAAAAAIGAELNC
jgi:hypothetical protein